MASNLYHFALSTQDPDCAFTVLIEIWGMEFLKFDPVRLHRSPPLSQPDLEEWREDLEGLVSMLEVTDFQVHVRKLRTVMSADGRTALARCQMCRSGVRMRPSDPSPWVDVRFEFRWVDGSWAMVSATPVKALAA